MFFRKCNNQKFLFATLALFLVTLLHSPTLTTSSSYADGGTDLACWKAKLMVDCPATFGDTTLDVDFAGLLDPPVLTEGDIIPILSKLNVDDSINVTTEIYKEHGYYSDHTNVHACKVSGGFCSPFVTATPGLVTHTPAKFGDEEESITFEPVLEAGDWTFIVHFRLYIDDNIRVDFAKGIIVNVKPKLVEISASDDMRNAAIAFAIVGAVISFAFFISVFKWRHTRVFRYASWKFCAVSTLGGIIANLSILLWVPPLTDLSCGLRPFLLPIAFDIVYFPLLLKTWRLKQLFGGGGKMKKMKITDFLLAKFVFLPIIVDVLIAGIWFGVGAPAPTQFKSLISEELYENFCSSDGSGYFMAIILALKIPMVLWGLILAWQTRKLSTALNESSHILLSMLNLFFVGTYVIVVQFLITDSQNALVMLRVMGTFIAATGTVSIVMGPKVYQLLFHGDIADIKQLMKEQRDRDSVSSKSSNCNGTSNTAYKPMRTTASKMETTIATASEYEIVGNGNRNNNNIIIGGDDETDTDTESLYPKTSSGSSKVCPGPIPENSSTK